MVSKWRQNVADLGWVGGPYSLIAYLVLSPFPYEYYICRLKDFPQWGQQVYRLAGSSAVPTPIGAPMDFGGNFPFGYIVEADHP